MSHTPCPHDSKEERTRKDPANPTAQPHPAQIVGGRKEAGVIMVLFMGCPSYHILTQRNKEKGGSNQARPSKNTKMNQILQKRPKTTINHKI
jgi:hypothetical protein